LSLDGRRWFPAVPAFSCLCGCCRGWTLAADEFIRRFLLHALPDGFHCIRHYGFFANRQRAHKLALCSMLLAEPLGSQPVIAPNVDTSLSTAVFAAEGRWSRSAGCHDRGR
jgi:Putative transposase